MGLFFSERAQQARKKTPAGTANKVIRLQLQQRKLDCGQCPLDRVDDLEHPKMLPTGAKNPLVYMLGEAPGKNDDEVGEQFTGSSGDMIRELIPDKYADRVRWNNTLRCRPPGSRDPEPIETECCRGLQTRDIEESKPKIIVGFGNYALRWALGDGRNATDWRGRIMPLKVGTHVCWFMSLSDPDVLLHNRDKRRDEANSVCFERDMQRVFWWLENNEVLPEVETDYLKGITCLAGTGLDEMKTIYDWLAYVKDLDHSIDVETSALRPYETDDARILTFAIGTYEQTFAFPFKHPEAHWSHKHMGTIVDALRDYFETGEGVKWAHQVKFEQEWIASLFGLDAVYKSNWGCTMAQAHTLDERRSVALDDLTQWRMGFRIKDLSAVDRENLAAEPLERVLPYNGMDSKYCHALSLIQAEELDAEGMQHVYERFLRDTPGLVQIQRKGLVRDVPALKLLDAQLLAQKEKVERQILKNKDVEEFIAAGNKFNPASPQTVAAFFRDWLKIPQKGRKHKAGSYSVDEDALSNIKHTAAKLLLEARGVAKNHGTYVLPLILPEELGRPEPKKGVGKHVHRDKLLHPSYSNLITVTGRLQSEDPNAQNFPRRKNKEIRRAIGCPPGYRFLAFDYGQLEARVVASISKDKILSKEIHNKQDIHGDWTDLLGAKFVPIMLKETRKKLRDSIKQYWTFANFYGNVLESVAYDLSQELEVDISPERLAPFFDEFWDRYKGVLKWQDNAVAKYWETGYVETKTGFRRREPMTRNEMINQPIQGTAGHLVIDAETRICRVSYEEDDDALTPVLNVHDDLSFYFPQKRLDDLIPYVAEQMCRAPPEFELTVPLTVEVSLGDNWCDKEELATFTIENNQLTEVTK
jgi:uracil-DNA glycosylase family 4